MTNPLDGVDDLITRYMLSSDMTTRRTLRSAIRAKIAQANLIINQGIAAGNVQRLGELHEAADKLAALEDAGVDNWDGYSIAMESLREKE